MIEPAPDGPDGQFSVVGLLAEVIDEFLREHPVVLQTTEWRDPIRPQLLGASMRPACTDRMLVRVS